MAHYYSAIRKGTGLLRHPIHSKSRGPCCKFDGTDLGCEYETGEEGVREKVIIEMLPNLSLGI